MKATLTLIMLSLSGLNVNVFRKHFFMPEKMNWTNAKKHCREQHDDLSTVTAEEALMLSANPQLTGTHFWIGLQQSPDRPNLWIWSGGHEEAVHNWDNGEPNGNNEQCGSVKKSNARLHNSKCLLSLEFYCMEVFQLMVVNENMTWDEALNYCRQHYTDLEEIMTEVVNNAVKFQTARVWTGLHFMAGHWFWVSGDDLQYKAWSTEGELQCPDRNLRCGALDRESNTWSPRNCEEKLNFVCFVKI